MEATGLTATPRSNDQPALAAATDPESCYAALVARDARFDGRFFVGVRSTGVYCRPVCRVRVPLQRNCRFFVHAAAAEVAGFRPCLRCRPELAPGLSLIDSSHALARHAAQLLDAAATSGQALGMKALAAELGVSDRHLRRIFVDCFGVAPLAYLNTRRLLVAKQMLTDTAMPVTRVALGAGFGSLRRFNAAFSDQYRLNPSELRRQSSRSKSLRKASDITVRLGFRPPYDTLGMGQFLHTRAVPGLETLTSQGDNFCYARTLSLTMAGQACAGWVRAETDLNRHEMIVTVSESLLPAIGTVLTRMRQALDLDADSSTIDAAVSRLGLPPRPGLRMAGAVCGFESAVRVILGQQVSVAAARTLTQRLVQALGEPTPWPLPGLEWLFPSARAIASADPAVIGRLGIVRQRVGALQALAQAVGDGSLSLQPPAPMEAEMNRLRSLPGIGEWTVQLIAMRAFGWPDACPSGDLGLLKALGTTQKGVAEAMVEPCRPWRAYAVLRLWQTLEKLDDPYGNGKN